VSGPYPHAKSREHGYEFRLEASDAGVSWCSRGGPVVRPFFVALFALLLSSALRAERMTVSQFRAMLVTEASARKSDAKIADKIGSVDLSEQLTPVTLNQIRSQINPGPKTSQALALQSDLSGFLDPPDSERPDQAPPDPSAQRRMLRRAVEFADLTLHRMPDFLATRITRVFDDSPLIVSDAGWYPAHTNLHPVGAFSEPITYRNGKEVFDLSSGRQAPSSPSGLTSSGEFGPILATVINDAARGQMTWRYWQQSPAGRVAVFRFDVPSSASHYLVGFWVGAPTTSFDRHINDSTSESNCYRGAPGYHGLLSIDPSTGNILRIAIQADLPRSERLGRADLFVDYGSVRIGGRAWICPVHSVAVSLIHFPEASPARSMLCVNDVSFAAYHRFGADVRVLQ